MQKIYESKFCDVSYLKEKNLVFVEWKKYCELNTYRSPLTAALQVIREHKCNYIADTRNGFENNPEDTKWVSDYFMPTASEYGCQTVFFIIDKDNSLKNELEGQANDSANIMNFKYIFNIDEI